jgi:Putative Ig domain
MPIIPGVISSSKSNRLTPQIPTIGTASVVSTTSVSVSFTPATYGANPSIYYLYDNTNTQIGSGTTSPIVGTKSFTAGVAYTFYVKASNAYGTSGASGSSNSISPNPYATLAINTSALDTYLNKGQTTGFGAVTATGGSGNYTFSIASGTMPSGLTFNSNGTITGTVSTSSAQVDSALTFTVTDTTTTLTNTSGTVTISTEAWGSQTYTSSSTWTAYTGSAWKAGANGTTSYFNSITTVAGYGGGGGISAYGAGGGFAPTPSTGVSGGHNGNSGAIYGGGAGNYTAANANGNVVTPYNGGGGTGSNVYGTTGTQGSAGVATSNTIGGDGGAYGGGGGSGNASPSYGGGGGGLGYVTSLSVTSGSNYTVTVGSGGAYAAGTYHGGSGANGVVRIVWGSNHSFPSNAAS